MRPEFPYLAAGAVAVTGATIRDKKFPDGETLARVIIGTVVLVIVASATAETRIAPLVRAIGFLLLLSTIMAAVNITLKRSTKQ